MIHSFCRLILACLGLYTPAVGTRYYYASNGPFSEKQIFVLDVRQGFVQYGVEYADGTRVVTWTSLSTFAMMCRKYEGSESNG